MGITTILSKESSDGTDRRRAIERAADRVETSAGAVAEASTRARRAAGDRAERAVDRGVDAFHRRVGARVARDNRGGIVERTTDEVSERVTDGLLEPATDELLERAFDRPADEIRSRLDGDEDPLDRAVEAFLRRYDLDATRLDDGTLATIRSRLAREGVKTGTRPDRPEAEGPSSVGSSATTGSNPNAAPDIDRAIASAWSRLCDDLDLESDRDPRELIEATLQRDAAVVGHAIERFVGDELPRLIEAGAREVEAREAGVGGATATDRSAIADGFETDSPPFEATTAEAEEPIDAVGSAARPVASAAIAALTLLSDDAATANALARAIGPLVASPTAGGAGASIESLLSAVPVTTALRVGEGGLDLVDGLDLASLRPRSRGATALVALFVANLVAMTIGAWLSRERAPPIPDEIRGPDGESIVTAEQVRLGKKLFQANGLMNHGSILGNGSYFGVDLTADALELKAAFMREYYARERGAESFDALDEDERTIVADRVEGELDAEAPEGPIARYSAAEAYAHRRIRDRYVDRYCGGAPERGIPQGFVETPERAERIADFACWTAWMAHTNRPGSDHSYTNDWPYVPGTGNRPTGQVLVWSTISVVLLVAGGGAGVWAYHSFDLAEPTTEVVDVPPPDAVSVTPAQYAAAWYVPVAGALFVAQALVGALLAHYYVERTGFYGLGDALGIDLVSMVPFSIGRTWHVNLGVLWITTLWLAGGLFLPGLFADRDPPRQAEAATALLGALVVATVGAFAGVWLGIQGKLGAPDEGELWWLFGSEGLEYLETGRFWKLSLLGALAGWTGLVLRSVRRLEEPPTGLGHFMTYAGGSIALMFGASMLYTPETNLAVTEFWRWWVVHMWVEGVFEFFVTAVISVALVSMDLLEQADAETAILFEVFAIMAAGIVGVSHHYWWVGLPDFWVPVGTTFSTLEFVPLVFVLYRSFGEYRSLKAQKKEFPYALPLLFIVGSSVWNFVGGGVLGFFVNLPVINYYEHGTYLTVAHAHTATFGAFGLLALGLGTYVLRVVTPDAEWEPAWFRAAFWLTNVGLVVMTLASLLPIGFVQLRTAYQEGYAAARSLEFYERSSVQTMLWARTLGDTPMILGAVAFTVGAVRHLLATRRHRVDDSRGRYRLPALPR